MIKRRNRFESRRRGVVREGYCTRSARYVDNDGFGDRFLYRMGEAAAEAIADMTNDDEDYGNPADYFDTELEYLSSLTEDEERTVDKLYDRLVKDVIFKDALKEFLKGELVDLVDWAADKI